MNKPAAKEPSMDEILSSIRQIIADDDAGMSAADTAADEGDDDVMSNDELDALHSFDIPDAEQDDDGDALELSLDQVVDEDDQDEAMAALDDIEMPAMAVAAAESEPDADDNDATMVLPDDVAFEPQAAEPKRSSHSLPDPSLSADMADRLLEPATGAAVKSAFSRLNALSLGSGSVTIENMVREMLRPMLKEWLDENLPGVVEKMVEKEIERVSRGG